MDNLNCSKFVHTSAESLSEGRKVLVRNLCSRTTGEGREAGVDEFKTLRQLQLSAMDLLKMTNV